MRYEVGRHVTEFEGRALCGYWRTCPTCAQTRHHETRAVEDTDGTRKEIEVCSTCGRIQKVSSADGTSPV